MRLQCDKSNTKHDKDTYRLSVLLLLVSTIFYIYMIVTREMNIYVILELYQLFNIFFIA